MNPPERTQQTYQMYRYYGDPETCWAFIQDCAGCLDWSSSEFNKVSFLVLCLGGRALRWAAQYLDIQPIEEVSFWPIAKELLVTFSRKSQQSSTHPSTTLICRTSIPSPGPDSTASASPVGCHSSSPSASAGAITAPPMGQATTTSPVPDCAAASSPVGCHSSSASAGAIAAPPMGRATTPSPVPDNAVASFPVGCHSSPSSVPTSIIPASPMSRTSPPRRNRRRLHPPAQFKALSKTVLRSGRSRRLRLQGLRLQCLHLQDLSLQGLGLQGLCLQGLRLQGLRLFQSPLCSLSQRLRLQGLCLQDLQSFRCSLSQRLRLQGLRLQDLQSFRCSLLQCPRLPRGKCPRLLSPCLQSLPLRSLPLRSLPLRSLPLRSLPLQKLPLQVLPLQVLPLQGPPLQNLPLQGPPLQRPFVSLLLSPRLFGLLSPLCPVSWFSVAGPPEPPGPVSCFPPRLVSRRFFFFNFCSPIGPSRFLHFWILVAWTFVPKNKGFLRFFYLPCVIWSLYIFGSYLLLAHNSPRCAVPSVCRDPKHLWTGEVGAVVNYWIFGQRSSDLLLRIHQEGLRNGGLFAALLDSTFPFIHHGASFDPIFQPSFLPDPLIIDFVSLLHLASRLALACPRPRFSPAPLTCLPRPPRKSLAGINALQAKLGAKKPRIAWISTDKAAAIESGSRIWIWICNTDLSPQTTQAFFSVVESLMLTCDVVLSGFPNPRVSQSVFYRKLMQEIGPLLKDPHKQAPKPRTTDLVQQLDPSLRQVLKYQYQYQSRIMQFPHAALIFSFFDAFQFLLLMHRCLKCILSIYPRGSQIGGPHKIAGVPHNFVFAEIEQQPEPRAAQTFLSPATWAGSSGGNPKAGRTLCDVFTRSIQLHLKLD
ncbi:uncharacterized protein [Nothobranchius furzeri]|uniref:uncharacterized protein n=1 Tax=Nothobranchius furzeri TaxID=105023 RepID=UPI003904B23E